MELGHFDNHFIKNTRKKGPAGEHLEAFSPRYSENYILNGKFNPKIDTIRVVFSQNQATFFNFQKRAGEAPPPPPP